MEIFRNFVTLFLKIVFSYTVFPMLWYKSLHSPSKYYPFFLVFPKCFWYITWDLKLKYREIYTNPFLSDNSCRWNKEWCWEGREPPTPAPASAAARGNLQAKSISCFILQLICILSDSNCYWRMKTPVGHLNPLKKGSLLTSKPAQLKPREFSEKPSQLFHCFFDMS